MEWAERPPKEKYKIISKIENVDILTNSFFYFVAESGWVNVCVCENACDRLKPKDTSTLYIW